jgi:hypothetical protein
MNAQRVACPVGHRLFLGAVVDRDRGLAHLSEGLDLRDVLVLGRHEQDVQELAGGSTVAARELVESPGRKSGPTPVVEPLVSERGIRLGAVSSVECGSAASVPVT